MRLGPIWIIDRGKWIWESIVMSPLSKITPIPKQDTTEKFIPKWGQQGIQSMCVYVCISENHNLVLMKSIFTFTWSSLKQLLFLFCSVQPSSSFSVLCATFIILNKYCIYSGACSNGLHSVKTASLLRHQVLSQYLSRHNLTDEVWHKYHVIHFRKKIHSELKVFTYTCCQLLAFPKVLGSNKFEF